MELRDVEFSPNGNLLYASSGWYSTSANGQIIQYDLLAGNSVAIETSKAIVYNHPISTNGGMGELQLGPDGKIYWEQGIVNSNFFYLN